MCPLPTRYFSVNELHRLRDELRAREDVIKCLRARLGDRFDAELECRLLNDQLKKLQEGLRKVVGKDETPLKVSRPDMSVLKRFRCYRIKNCVQYSSIEQQKSLSSTFQVEATAGGSSAAASATQVPVKKA